jgi:hypothetical protein
MTSTLELIVFSGCPNVAKARAALDEAGLRYEVVDQAGLTVSDPRREFSSPTLLVDGRLALGSASGAKSCSWVAWDVASVSGAVAEFAPESVTQAADLTGKQRIGRGAAGVLMLAGASLSLSFWPLSAVLGWFGLSHLVAAVTRYSGCPELGAIPSIILRRNVDTGCAPWRWIDHRLNLR